VDKTMQERMLFEVEAEDAMILLNVGNANASNTA
jgi:hypothetical protein